MNPVVVETLYRGMISIIFLRTRKSEVSRQNTAFGEEEHSNVWKRNDDQGVLTWLLDYGDGWRSKVQTQELGNM